MVRFPMDSVQKIIHLEPVELPGSDWSVVLRISLGKASIRSSGAPRLRLAPRFRFVHFLDDFIEKSIDSELWSSWSQTGLFPYGFYLENHSFGASGAPKLVLVHFIKHSIQKIIHLELLELPGSGKQKNTGKH